MSQQLARRTGTVGALVAAASVTMVAGVWPALGVASAADRGPDLRPGRVNSSAPGQVAKQQPVAAAPVTETAPKPNADAPGQVKQEAAPAPVLAEPAPAAQAPGQVKKDAAPIPDKPAPAAEAPGQVKKDAAPVEGAPTEAALAVEPAGQPGKGADAVGGGAAGGPGAATVAGGADTGGTTTGGTGPGEPSTTEGGAGTAPVAAAPGRSAPVVTGPVSTAPVATAPVAAAPETTAPVVGPSTGVVGPALPTTAAKEVPPGHAPVRVGPAVPVQAQSAPVQARPEEVRSPQQATGSPAQQPAVGPRRPAPAEPVAVVGPAVPVAATVAQAPVGPLTTAPRARTAAAPVRPPATVFTPSRNALVAAADAMPLRPTGASPISLPAPARPYSDPEVLPAGLTGSLPSIAAGTAEAVARTPQLPLGIAAVVVLFLLVQNRIDRRDPKLALARLEDDEPLVFVPRDSVVHLRLVQAA